MGARAASRRIVRLGRIAGFYGVRGWLRVRSDTEPRARIFDYAPWLVEVDGEWERVGVADGRTHGQGLVVQLEGVSDREAAGRYVGADIAADREQMPPLPAGEHYWADLEGLRVVNLDGVALGVVERILQTGANDVLVVRGDRERLVPYVPGAVVHTVDLEGGTLEVDWDPEF